MNVKRYRAATMRDALEKVKKDLGEDALVLDSKRMQTGGFLGFGAKEQIEVRVSADPVTSKPAAREKPSPQKSTRFMSLSLNDGPAASPQLTPPSPKGNTSAFSALAARAYAEETKPAVMSKTARKAQPSTDSSRVELSTNEPRTPRQDLRPDVLKQPESPIQTTENQTTKGESMSAELNRLRAEVREVKFTLNVFTSHNLSASRTASSLAKTSETENEIYDSPYYETYLQLTALGLPADLARIAVRAAIAGANGSRDVNELARTGLANALPFLINFANDPLAPSISGTHAVVALVGPTGVGKTTTVAKLAARAALRERRRVELITLDTYRIAAVEQLRTYAEIIGAGFHVPRSVLELDALVQRFSREATVLIDTIGRSARDLADQMELADYLRANQEIAKCLVIQATTHPADAQIAINKFGLFGANNLVITKLDETGRPGAAVSTAVEAGLPLAYLCNGQRVPEDIENATAESFAARVLSANALPAVPSEGPNESFVI